MKRFIYLGALTMVMCSLLGHTSVYADTVSVDAVASEMTEGESEEIELRETESEETEPEETEPEETESEETESETKDPEAVVPSAVKHFLGASSKSGAVLSWETSDLAEGYLIYGYHGSPKNGAKYGYIGMTGKTRFTDTKAYKDDWNFYWVYPYIHDETGKIIAGPVPEADAQGHHYVYAHTHSSESEGKVLCNEGVTCDLCKLQYIKPAGHTKGKTEFNKPQICTKCGANLGKTQVRHVLLIGDSRTYYMGLGGGDAAKDFEYLSEGGAATGLINTLGSGDSARICSLLGQVNSDAILNTLSDGRYVDITRAVKEQKITTIVYLLGFNNLGAEAHYQMGVPHAKKMLLDLKRMTGCEIYFASALGVDSNKCKSISNDTVNRFNTEMKAYAKSIGVGYVELNENINVNGMTSDGMHLTEPGLKKMANYLHQVFFGQ